MVLAAEQIKVDALSLAALLILPHWYLGHSES